MPIWARMLPCRRLHNNVVTGADDGDGGVKLAVGERSKLTLNRGQNLADSVHDAMLALIRDGSWTTGMKLPSELSLSQHFGTSRPIVRQALARLRDDGLVQSRQGSGSYLSGSQPIEEIHYPEIASIADLESFLNFREGIEGEAAALAALSRTDFHIDNIEKTARNLQESHEAGLQFQCDFAFHRAVAEASANPFYVNAVTSLKDHISLGMSVTWRLANRRPDFLEAVIDQHLAITEAIRSQDSDAARKAMRSHLKWERSRLMSG